jgi:hypothetical protein
MTIAKGKNYLQAQKLWAVAAGSLNNLKSNCKYIISINRKSYLVEKPLFF